jgi:hypothetical protein
MRPGLAAVVVLALVGLAPPAHARQIDARDRPSVSGPLTRVIKQCTRERRRAPSGVVIAVAKNCVFFYSFNPARETNPRRDYGAIWLQTTLDAKRGWCAATTKSDIRVPRGSIPHARRPQAVRTGRRHWHRTVLVVDASDNALRNGRIARWFVLFPRVLRGNTLDGGRLFRSVWRGSTARTVASASGLEISWRQAAGPPTTLKTKLAYLIRNKRGGSC